MVRLGPTTSVGDGQFNLLLLRSLMQPGRKILLSIPEPWLVLLIALWNGERTKTICMVAPKCCILRNRAQNAPYLGELRVM